MLDQLLMEELYHYLKRGFGRWVSRGHGQADWMRGYTITPDFISTMIVTIGSWMNVNGEAIYKTKPWHYQNDTVNGNFW